MISRYLALRRLAVVLAVSLVAACTAPGGAQPARPAEPTVSVPVAATRPNIVFVLTDDLSENLLPYMPHVQALARSGTSFANYTVTDSLCCPSRASIFTGRYPHNTRIFTNHGSDGGFNVFRGRGEESSTFATSLQQAGYRTALMGKYLNEYHPSDKHGTGGTYVPPGWTDWAVAGSAYRSFDYPLNENHTVRHYGSAPGDYITDVLSARASAFITASAGARQPFMIEVATFAPHAPYVAAPRDAHSFPLLTAPRSAAYDVLPANAPGWLSARAPLTPRQVKALDVKFRKRVQAVQSVDRMLASLQATLARAGVADDTIVVFSSDNGFHLGEYRLNAGKMTAYDTDIRVPLIAAGPGVAVGRTVAAPAQNIDLRPTFEDLAGAGTPPEVDGQSLRPLLAGEAAGDWRTASLIEHHGPDNDHADPDFQARASGNPPSYAALRTATATYVEYTDGSREYYDRTRDPSELVNIAGQLPAARLVELHSALSAMTSCHGQDECGRAARLAR